MKFSAFGDKFNGPSGIGNLMDDLGRAMASEAPMLMLGGGNPGRIPELEARLCDELRKIANDENRFAQVAGAYDAPNGESRFIDALVKLINTQYNWGISKENIAITNGSQNAFFFIFNLFGGKYADGSTRKILLPLAPEYIGYEDVFVDGQHFVANKPTIDYLDDDMFKYRVDFDTLEITEDIAAICVSRPTNPTGNVLTDDEMTRLDEIARTNDIPLIIDKAYGLPFPNIIFSKGTPTWNQNTIMCLSLSKFGLPGLRTGIVIADTPVIDAISALNAITNLSPNSSGAALVTPLFESGEVLDLSTNVVRPFYQEKAASAVRYVRDALSEYPVKIHKPEGALFLWLWFKDLPITTLELYQRLKNRGVLIIPSQYFFPGIDEDWQHKHECIRLTYSQSEETVREGIRIIGEEVRAIYDARACA
ncbi:MAG: valine--pyruvate transaminase [Pseudomonadota bacterium]